MAPDSYVDGNTDGAWYQGWFYKIAMGDYHRGSKYGRAVWRHEWGHHMDHVAKGQLGSYWSNRPTYRAAMDRDYERLKPKLGEDWGAL